MQLKQQLAAEKLARLPRLLVWAHASGRHDLYRKLRLLNLELLSESDWQPPPLSKADQEAVRRGELFTDIRAWHARLHMLKAAGQLPDVSFEIAERPRARAQLSGSRANSARRSARRTAAGSPGRIADDPELDPPGRRCACGCGRLITRVALRGPQPETYDASCRKRLERQRKRGFEYESLVVKEIAAGRLAPYDGLLWVLFPDACRRRYPGRVAA